MAAGGWPEEQRVMGAEDMSRGDMDEPLLPQPRHAPPKKGAGVLSSAVNIANNALGSGLLALPYAFKEASVGWAVIILLLCGAASTYSFVLLARCCDMIDDYNYRAIGAKAGGKKFALFVQCVMVAYTTGTCVSYVVLLGDFIPKAFAHIPTDGFLPAWLVELLRVREHGLVAVGAVLMFPLSNVKKLSQLKYASAAALLCILYVASVVAYRYCTVAYPEKGHHRGDVKWFETTPQLLLAFPIISFAFTTHYNAPSYFKELRVRRPSVMRRAAIPGLMLCGAVYLTAGLCGYLLFGERTLGDIVLNFDESDILIFWGRLALAACMLLSYPMVFHSLRTSLHHLLVAPDAPATPVVVGASRFISCQAPPPGSPTCGADSLTPLLHPPPSAPKSDNINKWQRLKYSSVLVPMHVALGCVLPRLEVILGFNGAVFGTLIVYVLPAVMYIRVKKAPIYCEGLPAVGLLTAGVFLGVAGVSANVARLFGFL